MQFVQFVDKTRVVARCAVGPIRGRRALGRHVIELPLHFRLKPLGHARPVHIVSIDGDLETPVGMVPCRPLMPVLAVVDSDPVVMAQVCLDAAQVHLVDEARIASGKLDLALHCAMLVDYDSLGVGKAEAIMRFQPEESEWLRFLADSGFGESESFDFALVSAGQSEQLAKAAAELKAAISSYRKRDWHAVLTMCRRAFEHVAVSQPTNIKNESNMRDRIRNANAAVEKILHAGPHIVPGEVNRHDARQALLMSLAVFDRRNREEADAS